jgi:hypothetical protein
VDVQALDEGLGAALEAHVLVEGVRVGAPVARKRSAAKRASRAATSGSGDG